MAQLAIDGSGHLTVLNYLPKDEAEVSYVWLELCRRLQARFPTRFAHKAFVIPAGQLRPFSYHVYDTRFVHIGLRSYSPARGTPTLSAAIMLSNENIARRFTDEFLENYRSVRPLHGSGYAAVLAELLGNASDRRLEQRVITEVDDLMAP